MKRFTLLLILLLCLGCAMPAQAVTIKSSGDLEITPFLQEHPDISLENTDWDYFTTQELANRLTTRTLEDDFYFLPQHMINRETMMRKGFCLDLSGSQTLMEQLQRIHPRIAEQLMYDGRLYAWPTGITFSYMRIDSEAWAAAGFTIADVPGTFSELLDFAERWCDQLEADPALGLHLMGGLNGYQELFREQGKSLYIDWLLELLIHQAAIQQQYAGEPLHFDDEDLQALIRPCVTVGERVYRAEAGNAMENRGLFVLVSTWTWPDAADDVVSLRLHDDQPDLVEARLQTIAVNPATAHPELCMDILESMAAHPVEDDRPYDQYFFVDAQPRTLPGIEETIAEEEEQIESLRLQLQDASLSEARRLALEDELARYERYLKEDEAIRWVLKPEALMDYQAHVELLHFPTPSILTETDAGSQIYTLRQQVGSGAISVDQFIRRLCEITTMIQQEQ